MSNFVKLPSGLVVNLDRVDRMGETYAEPYGRPYWLAQSCDSYKGAECYLSQEDADALLAAMGVGE